MQPSSVLKFSEMAWWYNCDGERRYLGEAGNPSHLPKNQCSAMRIGDDVVVQSRYESFTIPASTILQGFRPEQNGLSMKEAMEEGVHYLYNLRSIIE